MEWLCSLLIVKLSMEWLCSLPYCKIVNGIALLIPYCKNCHGMDLLAPYCEFETGNSSNTKHSMKFTQRKKKKETHSPH
jgi:hypothetical protein